MDLVQAEEPHERTEPLAVAGQEAIGRQWARDVFIVIVFLQLWLVLLHLRLAQHPDLDVKVVGGAFDLTREATIPSTFSSLLAFFVAAIAGYAGALCRAEPKRRKERAAWWLLSLTFLAVGIDDGAALHERFNAVISLSFVEQVGYPSYPWHLVVAPWFAVGILLGTTLLVVSGRLQGLQILVWTSAVTCFGLAGALDFVEGWEILSRAPNTPIPEKLGFTMLAEECLEMLGTALFAYGALHAAGALAVATGKEHAFWSLERVATPKPSPENSQS